MSNLLQAIAMDILAKSAEVPTSSRTRTAQEVQEYIYAEAAQRNRPFVNTTPEAWRSQWLQSQKFFLMRIPLRAAALTCKPRDPAWMVTRILAEAGNDSELNPITVEINKMGVGRTKSGFIPPIIVIDGKHRFCAASLRGSSHIWSWVGEMAAERLRDYKPAERDEKMLRGSLLRAMNASRLETVCEMYGDGGQQAVESIDAVLSRELGADPTVVRRIVSQFQQTGKRYKVGGAVRSVSPPGWSGTVEKMKGHPEVDNPHALAWYLHDQGHRPKGK